jgi:hypothetical protein
MADDDEASALLRQGVELRRVHRNAEALEVFTRALALSPTPVGLAQVALAEQSLGRWVEAEMGLRSALEHLDDPWIAKNRQALEEALEEVERHTARLTVDVDVADVTIVLDGRAIERGKEALVPAGAAILAVQARDYLPDIRRIELAPSDHAHLAIVLTPIPRADATPASLAPVVPPPAPPLVLPERSPTIRWLPPTLMGIGIAGIGVGSYFGVRTLQEKDARDALCHRVDGNLLCQSGARTADADARSFATWSTMSFVVGAGLAAAGGIWWAIDASHPHSKAQAWRLEVAPGFRAVSLSYGSTFP